MALHDRATVTINVVDENGAPFPGVTVKVQSASGTTLATAITSTEGVAALSTLPRGRHRLVASNPSGVLSTTVLTVGLDHGIVTVTLDKAGVETTRFSAQVTISAEVGAAQGVEASPQATSVLTRDDIDSRAKTNLAQIGNEGAGLYWQRTSPTVGAVFVRGLTGAKVNLFVDGIRFSNAAARGGVNTFFNLLDPSLIESAEVTRGPSSAQYGSDAMGGSVQLYSRAPAFTVAGSTVSGRASLTFGSADRSGGADATIEWFSPSFSVVAGGTGRRVDTLRTGGGFDSHHAVTRFFGISSTLVQGGRLPNTDFDQYGGSLRAAWLTTPNLRILGSYLRGQIDGSKRYDQLLGGDGNLIADIRDLTVNVASVRLEHLNPGFADFLTVGYSYNDQYEERVNQGGNGNPAAAINHEPEKTKTSAFQARANKGVGRHILSAGGDLSFEKVAAASFAENATTFVQTVRRGRVPDGATYRSGGLYVQDSFDPTSKAHLVGALRASFAKYSSSAATAPVVGGRPLWPDDALSASSLTFRVGGSYEIATGVRALAHIGQGFRAPHITDLATLGLTGSGFEASYDSVAALGAQIGTSANSAAISTGRAVSVLDPEKSLTWEFGLSARRGPIDSRLSVFWNDIKGNIEKYAAILPPGSVGRSIGSDVITSQLPNGVVFVGLSANPVLIRSNQENSRIFGVEHEMRVKLSHTFSLRTSATYLHAELSATGAPPNIEGGTPNPDAWIALRWKHKTRPLYVEPYAHLASEQRRLSTLDLDDRRTGASRSRNSITAFFNNGARARGYVSAGLDGRFGTADDTLIATGESLAQIISRVLGPSGATNSLYTSVHGYRVFGLRVGWTIAKRHQIALDFENIADENFRGPSWGLDAAGRNIFARYSIKF